MDPRFPPLKDQCQIGARPACRALPLPMPSLPVGEMLLAGIALILLLAA
jgi:hypothetical protein